MRRFFKNLGFLVIYPACRTAKSQQPGDYPRRAAGREYDKIFKKNN